MLTWPICYPAVIPPSGFRWIYRESEEHWRLCDPPDDWPEIDYESVATYEGPSPKLCDKFFLATSAREVYGVHRAHGGLGPMISEPNLFLKFASIRQTPSAILELANAYGLLRYTRLGDHFSERISISRLNSPDIVTAFPNERSEERTILFVESAFTWLQKHFVINCELNDWAITQASGDLNRIGDFLDSYSADGGSLTYIAKMDHATGQPYSTLIANSFQGMLDVQWGLLLVAGAVNKQCEECRTWIAIAPGLARPEKKYCSDACRMRGYRKRKAQASKRRTRKKSQRTP